MSNTEKVECWVRSSIDNIEEIDTVDESLDESLSNLSKASLNRNNVTMKVESDQELKVGLEATMVLFTEAYDNMFR